MVAAAMGAVATKDWAVDMAAAMASAEWAVAMAVAKATTIEDVIQDSNALHLYFRIHQSKPHMLSTLLMPCLTVPSESDTANFSLPVFNSGE